eukprot:763089-Hanusia_phi.AAC.8
MKAEVTTPAKMSLKGESILTTNGMIVQTIPTIETNHAMLTKFIIPVCVGRMSLSEAQTRKL